MQNILNYTKANRREYTYLGVGTKSRYNSLDKITGDVDQILPCFLNNVNTTIRAIHFDPLFVNDCDFLELYFKSKGFSFDGLCWYSSDYRIEVIICPRNFNSNDNFLESLVTQTIQEKTQLVVQFYNGQELTDIFKNIYNNSYPEEKAYIRENVLFDITYGTECHCMTKLTEHEPMVDANGKFYNFLLYDEAEMLELIGLHPRMNKLIESYVMKKLSKVLNEDHVNYRRATRGEVFLFPNKLYGSDPEEIMNSLLSSIREILNILSKLNSLPEEKRLLFEEYSRNYRNMDMYKWYSDMTQLYK
jgi:hypothetical protein